MTKKKREVVVHQDKDGKQHTKAMKVRETPYGDTLSPDQLEELEEARTFVCSSSS